MHCADFGSVTAVTVDNSLVFNRRSSQKITSAYTVRSMYKRLCAGQTFIRSVSGRSCDHIVSLLHDKSPSLHSIYKSAADTHVAIFTCTLTRWGGGFRPSDIVCSSSILSLLLVAAPTSLSPLAAVISNIIGKATPVAGQAHQQGGVQLV